MRRYQPPPAPPPLPHTGATPDGTRAYARRFAPLPFVSLGRTGLAVSQAGFGSYRVDIHAPDHHAALRRALTSGINLIDTSTNYGDGDAERLIGYTLQMLHAGGTVAREEVVLVSKAGYLQGEILQRSRQRDQRGQPFPEIVPLADDLAHCIHPEFLADQLQQSMQRLQVTKLDVFLLHNPEYFLIWAERNAIPSAEAQSMYAARLTAAFAFLESQVAAGRLLAYGVSSNTFPAAADDPTFTSLSRCWEIAQAVSAHHHFRVIQLPLNLLETGAVTERNQPDGRTTLELAADLDIAVLVNRPLNARWGHGIVRLAAPPAAAASDVEGATAEPAAIERDLATLREMEQTLRSTYLPALPVAGPVQSQLADFLAVGHTLADRWTGFGTYANWTDIARDYLTPRVSNALAFIGPQLDVVDGWTAWTTVYQQLTGQLLRAIGSVYAAVDRRRSAQMHDFAVHAAPAWSAETLSQTAVRALRATSGVTSVLVGMRRPPYVDDVLADLARPIQKAPYAAAWAALKKRS